nr:pyridoxal phosphate-dependent aminotransferase [uncultured Cohaesibacter sp.]
MNHENQVAASATPMNDLLSHLSPEAQNAPASGIIGIKTYAQGKGDVIPLWIGEGAIPTPDFICKAAEDALEAGETFYTYQNGIPELRSAIAAYHERLYGRPFDPYRFSITGSGMQAIQMAVRMVISSGEEVIVPSPAWTNIRSAVVVAGGKPVDLALHFHPEGWKLDIDELFDACTEKTRALFINTPNNPTGWVATLDELKAILDFARKRNIWIIADEIYTRFYYGKDRENAPSFYEIADDDDKILFVNSMSKNWAMTGWRVGWIGAPIALEPVIGNLIQCSTSGVAPFMQRAATVALNEGELFIAEQIGRARVGREKLLKAFEGQNAIRHAPPMGSFYYFFGLEGEPDALQLARRLVDEANVGLAPGFAFGQSGSAFMRLCFATNPDRLDQAISRLTQWMAR